MRKIYIFEEDGSNGVELRVRQLSENLVVLDIGGDEIDMSRDEAHQLAEAIYEMFPKTREYRTELSNDVRGPAFQARIKRQAGDGADAFPLNPQ